MDTQENSAQDNVDVQTLVAPLNLWLQWHGDGDPDDESEVCEGEVTWAAIKSSTQILNTSAPTKFDTR